MKKENRHLARKVAVFFLHLRLPEPACNEGSSAFIYDLNSHKFMP
ncbi:hypothetical protein [Pelagibacterium lentulum]|nr:hypothetical protein [Pelagibacterium lentulum]